jgi:hypothetical protein
VMRQAGDDRHGSRVRALIAVLDCGSRRRYRSGSKILTSGAGRCWFAAARAAADARSACTPGAGNSSHPGSVNESSFQSGRCSA